MIATTVQIPPRAAEALLRMYERHAAASAFHGEGGPQERAANASFQSALIGVAAALGQDIEASFSYSPLTGCILPPVDNLKLWN